MSRDQTMAEILEEADFREHGEIECSWCGEKLPNHADDCPTTNPLETGD